MKKKEQEYGPKNPNYQTKSKLIEWIGNPSGWIDPMLQLGLMLTLDERLSHKQTDLLIDALNEAGLLTYNSEFVHSEADPKTVDGTRWDIELDGKLQAQAIISFCFMTSHQNETERFERAVQLLNISHIHGSKMVKDSLSDISVFQRSTRELERIEKFLNEQGSWTDAEFVQAITEGFHASEPEEVFHLLQRVIYFGYAMGVRDADRARTREWEMWHS